MISVSNLKFRFSEVNCFSLSESGLEQLGSEQFLGLGELHKPHDNFLEDNTASMAKNLVSLQNLVKSGKLGIQHHTNGSVLLEIDPLPVNFNFLRSTINENSELRIADHAYCHIKNQQLVLCVPDSPVNVILLQPDLISILNIFKAPRKAKALFTELKHFSPTILVEALEIFAQAGILKNENCEKSENELSRRGIKRWEFHDALFHSKSRLGLHTNISGTSFIGDEPQTLPEMEFPRISKIKLPIIDIDKFDTNSVSVIDTINRRKSNRQNLGKQISLKDLSDFLFLTFRTGLTKEDTRSSKHYSIHTRPFPSAGGFGSYQLVLIISNCKGLLPGAYIYNSHSHELSQICATNKHTRQMLVTASEVTGTSCTPSVLISIATNFDQVFWKYSSARYALILKDVGVIMQTMYLVSTALNLAPCALGSGDTTSFSKLVSRNPFEFGLVGEFCLGGSSQ